METNLMIEIVITTLILFVASGMLVYALQQIGGHFKVSAQLTAVLLVGFGTSIAEFFIAQSASYDGVHDIILALAISIPVVSLTLVAGIATMSRRSIDITHNMSFGNFTHLSLGVLLFVILSHDGQLTRADGFLLVTVFLYFLWEIHEKSVSYTQTRKHNLPLPWSTAIAVATTVIMFIGANYLTLRIKEYTSLTQISVFFLTIVLIAPLTTFPEMIYETWRKSRFALSDLFTGIIIATSLLPGITAIFIPLNFQITELVDFNILYLVIVLIIFNFFSITKNKLSLMEGAFLIVAFFVYLISNIFIYLSL